MWRNFLKSIVRFLFNLLTRYEVSGIENIPNRGALILAANHMSRLDPPLIFILLKREDVTVLVADKYLRYPFIRFLINSVNGIWLHREDADSRALRVARNHLQKGGVLGIAPEGTRSQVEALIPAKTGVAYLADKTKAPVVPVAITGTEKAIWQLFHLRRPLITVRIGEPFQLRPLDRRDRSSSLQKNTDEIMSRIAAMLPPRYRGAYAGHPRVQEILAEQVGAAEMPQPVKLGAPYGPRNRIIDAHIK
ncbi:MAG TPA: lysophospholipid acyltransferase family protein [Anaerolineales bacterium]